MCALKKIIIALVSLTANLIVSDALVETLLFSVYTHCSVFFDLR